VLLAITDFRKLRYNDDFVIFTHHKNIFNYLITSMPNFIKNLLYDVVVECVQTDATVMVRVADMGVACAYKICSCIFKKCKYQLQTQQIYENN
jgi:predicted signal transduction protein with EAL and GGDEF domain